ncbi:hypothetical protein G9A89_022977 [Geosiphon pyriformis]|nr:hypothetical protein G9A89_022977 [Geosiphon pyriformis]
MVLIVKNKTLTQSSTKSIIEKTKRQQLRDTQSRIKETKPHFPKRCMSIQQPSMTSSIKRTNEDMIREFYITIEQTHHTGVAPIIQMLMHSDRKPMMERFHKVCPKASGMCTSKTSSQVKIKVPNQRRLRPVNTIMQTGCQDLGTRTNLPTRTKNRPKHITNKVLEISRNHTALSLQKTFTD